MHTASLGCTPGSHRAPQRDRAQGTARGTRAGPQEATRPWVAPGHWDRAASSLTTGQKYTGYFGCPQAGSGTQALADRCFRHETRTALLGNGMPGRKAGFGSCHIPHGAAASCRACQGWQQCLTHPEPASAAGCGHFVMDGDMAPLPQETGHFCHGRPHKNKGACAARVSVAGSRRILWRE